MSFRSAIRAREPVAERVPEAVASQPTLEPFLPVLAVASWEFPRHWRARGRRSRRSCIATESGVVASRSGDNHIPAGTMAARRPCAYVAAASCFRETLRTPESHRLSARSTATSEAFLHLPCRFAALNSKRAPGQFQRPPRRRRRAHPPRLAKPSRLTCSRSDSFPHRPPLNTVEPRDLSPFPVGPPEEPANDHHPACSTWSLVPRSTGYLSPIFRVSRATPCTGNSFYCSGAAK